MQARKPAIPLGRRSVCKHFLMQEVSLEAEESDEGDGVDIGRLASSGDDIGDGTDVET